MMIRISFLFEDVCQCKSDTKEKEQDNDFFFMNISLNTCFILVTFIGIESMNENDNNKNF